MNWACTSRFPSEVGELTRGAVGRLKKVRESERIPDPLGDGGLGDYDAC